MVKLSIEDKQTIVQAIREAEKGTFGEIRVHVRNGRAANPLVEARKTFVRLGMHKTALRSGVLLYIALGSRTFAIVGDTGIDARAGQGFWDATRDIMAERFSKGRIAEAIAAGVERAGRKLRESFPLEKINPNELSDTVTEE